MPIFSFQNLLQSKKCDKSIYISVSRNYINKKSLGNSQINTPFSDVASLWEETQAGDGAVEFHAGPEVGDCKVRRCPRGAVGHPARAARRTGSVRVAG
jgi:hypothetical protein